MALHLKPIVLIHGLFGNQSAPEIIEAFGKHKVYAPDLIGYGKYRTSHENGWTLEQQSAHIADFIRNLDLGPVNIVGHSVGGVVAALVASEYKSLVSSYTNVEGNFTLKDAFWSGQIAEKPLSEVKIIIEDYEKDPDRWIANSVDVITPFASRLAKEWLAYQPASTIRYQAIAVVEETKKASYLDKLRGLLSSDLPFFLIAGQKSAEGWDTPKWANNMCDMRINIPGVGHLMMMESPDKYANAILKCLSNNVPH